MSYNCTVYATDSGIATTYVSILDSGGNLIARYTFNYDGNASGNDVTSIADSQTLLFEAVAASGSTFSKWMYRVGSPSAAQQQESSNPFNYTAHSTVYIRAESSSGGGGGGGGGGGSWSTFDGGTYSDLAAAQSVSGVTIPTGQICVIAFSCANAGNAVLTGGPNLYAYLSDGTQYDSNAGAPTSVLASDISGALDFAITYSVAANTTYYLFARCADLNTSATASFTITPPSGGGGGSGGVHIFNGASWVQATPYVFDGTSWVQVTPYVFDGTTWVQAT